MQVTFLLSSRRSLFIVGLQSKKWKLLKGHWLHLAMDLTEERLLSSLGANEKKMGFLSSGSPGLRTKSLSSLTPANVDENNIQINPAKRKTLVLTERLHELLQTLHNAEQKGDLSEPFQADAFLQALREVNPLFQGNQQQDAHELLVCSLDYLREACQLVDKAQNKSLEDNSEAGMNAEQNNTELSVMKRGKQNSEKKKKKKSKKMFAEKEKDVKKGKRGAANATFPTSATNQATDHDQLPKVRHRFINHRKEIFINYIEFLKGGGRRNE
jgi:ubiquitin carboxyl-terminal hydrolase 1